MGRSARCLSLSGECAGPLYHGYWLKHWNSLGSAFGVTANIFSEKLYRKNHATRGPEARLYLVMGAAITFPAALFIYAWCTFPNVHWISLCIAITIIEFSSFLIYLAVFTYLADCYGAFASSALAGQSLSRNLFGMAFPLFTHQMYDAMTYKWANTLFACLALVMAPIPYVSLLVSAFRVRSMLNVSPHFVSRWQILFFYGPKLRARSKFASALAHKA
ncbi:hypothetical protein EIP86_001186 [Pleurotus ostreatoroseus]|nr:hypothetical protein EIP86_001186 [Pleurotus ostreatoroseus]